MPSRPAAAKRAPLPRASDYTGQFLKDWERLSRGGRHDMGRLKEVMLRLVANDGPLPPERRDHALQGEWQDHRECHVGGDFLLIYQLDDTPKRPSVTFVRAGTHADLFE